jgi:release factor glutamine methyltransferase
LGLSLVYSNLHTVCALINETAERIASFCPETPRLDTELLLAHALHTDKTGLYRSLHDIVPVRAREDLQDLVARRIKGEPISYILGRKEFWSFTVAVNHAVMVPRPDTEVLVEAALQLFPMDACLRVIDVGTGSGAIALALAKEMPNAFVIATDLSAEALQVAQRNADSNSISSITFLQGDLFEPVDSQTGAFDLVVSNPPYIPTAQIAYLPPGLRDYEPHLAFDGGADGLAFYRKMAHEAPVILKSGGFLLVEVGHNQNAAVRNIISDTGSFLPPETVLDLSGIERVMKAQRR